MKFVAFETRVGVGIALEHEGEHLGLSPGHDHYPGPIENLLSEGRSALRRAAATLRRHGQPVDLADAPLLPPLVPRRIICVGLNYRDHAEETGLPLPEVPTVFSRWPSSIVGSGQPMIAPKLSSQLDYEGELAAVIGRPGRHIARTNALEHVAGYACFNDGSVRDYQLRTAQWTLGKNFDRSGALGPALVASEALPEGASGLAIRTRVNGQLVQSSSTDQLIFDVAALVSALSQAFCLQPGDVIATGTPAGVGMARQPPGWLAAGDVCEVEIEGVGTLRNPVRNES
jgi:2-keto-4-pentenoate hydratase/2-oxohepta-3-ene-1,7-dioic acid hydratase in catechol pathway